MSTERSSNIHDYYFMEDCRVKTECLLPETIESLEKTNAEYSSDRAFYIRETYDSIQHTQEGLPFAYFRKDGDSQTDAVLIINPFGTPIAPRHSVEMMAEYVSDRKAEKKPESIEPNDANKLLQARFLKDSMDRLGFTDSEGRYLPLVVMSSPSKDHKSPLSKNERQIVATGDFSPFAKRALETVTSLGYGRIYAAGYSMGSIAANVVGSAEAHNVDILAGCYIGDAPNFKDRFIKRPVPLSLLLPFMFDSVGSPYKGDWINDGPEPRIDIARNGESYDAIGHWFGNGNLAVNLATGIGLSRNRLKDTLKFMNNKNIPTAISWSESRLMKGFYDFVKGEQAAVCLAAKGLLNLSRARQAPHISGENQVFLTDVMLRAMKFAQTNQ